MNWIKSHPFITSILVVWCTAMVFAAISTESPEASPMATIVVALSLGVIGAWILTIMSNATVGRSKKRREKDHTINKALGIRRIDSRPAVSQAQVKVAIVPNENRTVGQSDWHGGNTAQPHVMPSIAPLAEKTDTAQPSTMQHSVPPKVVQARRGNITLREILNYTPTEFEDFCAKALTHMGYQNMKRSGGAGDLQADIVGNDIHGRSTIVQCKRYKPGSQIGSPVIQSFIGMKSVHHRVDRGIFITTAGYSRPAIKLAQQHDIVLIDGDDLVKLAGLVFAPRDEARPKYQVRFCTNCGSEIESQKDRFCSECGNAIQR